jgi:hypothetical protein
MVSFRRADSRNLYLPLALRAYDTNVDQSSWEQIGFNPIGQIQIDYTELSQSRSEIVESLRGAGKGTPASLRNLDLFVRAIENDITRNGSYFGWIALDAGTSTVAITFRGTHGFDEWLKGALILPVPYPYENGDLGLVHAGFLIVYRSVRQSTADLLRRISVGQYNKLLICGHSLGAAVATLSSPDIYQQIGRHAVPEVRSFASPRPADAVFSRTLADRGLSVLTHRNRFDIVPDLPMVPYFHPDTIALIGGGELFNPKVSHDLVASYQTGLDALTSDDSVFGGLPSHPYIYSETG